MSLVRCSSRDNRDSDKVSTSQLTRRILPNEVAIYNREPFLADISGAVEYTIEFFYRSSSETGKGINSNRTRLIGSHAVGFGKTSRRMYVSGDIIVKDLVEISAVQSSPRCRAAALQDTSRKEAVVAAAVGKHVKSDTVPATALSPYRNSTRVSAEEPRILLDLGGFH